MTPILLTNVTIEQISGEDKALARVDGKVIFVDNAVPGDVVDIRIYKSKKSYAHGSAVHWHSYSNLRATPVCSHFGLCGGCKWQDIQYPQQLLYKQQIVSDALKHIGKLAELPEIQPTIGGEEQLFYRNKLQYGFSDKSILYDDSFYNKMKFNDQPAAGFHVPKLFERILDIDKCWLQPEPTNAIRLFVKDYLLKNGLTFHNIKRHEGWFRDLTIRTSSTGELMLICSFYYEDEWCAKLMNALQQAFPSISSLNFVINPKMNDYITDLEMRLHSGTPHIYERMESLQFKISPKSFFQTNTAQAIKLYQVVRTYAALTGTEKVYDLYTGTGSIAQFIAAKASKVTGIEYVQSAIDDALINAELNGITNCEFFAGDIAEVLSPAFIAKQGMPDLIITDPPRAGMHVKVVQALLEMKVPRIIYVSCNPATQARDLELLNESYRVVKIQPVDLFPHTTHVENVVLLELR
jgi:23S rRNA (uracil1939-C5)-methyltransferase